MSLGKRIDEAISVWPGDAKGDGRRAFCRAMQVTGVRGTSYPTLLRYLRDKDATEPSGMWFEMAASVLNVSSKWLQFGAGERTSEDEAAKLARGSAAVKQLAHDVENAFAKTFPAYRKLPDSVKGIVWRTWQDLRKDRQGVDAEVGLERPRALGKALHAPLQALGVDPATLTQWQLHSYVIGVCSALAPLAAERGLRKPKVGFITIPDSLQVPELQTL